MVKRSILLIFIVSACLGSVESPAWELVDHSAEVIVGPGHAKSTGRAPNPRYVNGVGQPVQRTGTSPVNASVDGAGFQGALPRAGATIQAAAPPRAAAQLKPAPPIRSRPAPVITGPRGGPRPRPVIPVAKPKPPRQNAKPVAVSLDGVLSAPPIQSQDGMNTPGPRVFAKALYCVDCSDNTVVLAKNTSAPMPIASITKLLTAMTVIEGINLDQVLEAPADIKLVQRHRVGLRPGDKFTVRDLLHGMLIESGNDCAELLARAYPNGGWNGFMRAMNRKAQAMGALRTRVFTPSGLDLNLEIGRNAGKPIIVKKANVASAEDVALIARQAFAVPLIREISSMKTYTMVTKNEKSREYPLHSNDRLLDKPIPVAGAKTGYTDLAGRCIVAMFNDVKKDKDYLVVVLNSPSHFKTAEKVYNWVCNP